ncbi:MAG: hypothetical protein AB9866_08875 [Syntrophobacteraceae bacterium]
MSIGQESCKGTRAVHRAFLLIKRSGLNFVGNIEPGDIFKGLADAIICEGFVGNLVLKMYEGLTEDLIRSFSEMVEQTGSEDRGQLDRIFEGFSRSFHYQFFGGAPLLGVKSPVLVAHGRSSAPAISSAIALACPIAADGLCRKMTEELEQDSSLVDFKYYNALLILDDFKKKWGFSPK